MNLGRTYAKLDSSSYPVNEDAFFLLSISVGRRRSPYLIVHLYLTGRDKQLHIGFEFHIVWVGKLRYVRKSTLTNPPAHSLLDSDS